jgi:CheY-like chemotaxis protein
VVLLDWNLPRVSGFEVLKWIRERPELAGLPVVVFSSSIREEDQANAPEFGAQGFVRKPSSGMKFGQVVERLRGKWMGAGA